MFRFRQHAYIHVFKFLTQLGNTHLCMSASQSVIESLSINQRRDVMIQTGNKPDNSVVWFTRTDRCQTDVQDLALTQWLRLTTCHDSVHQLFYWNVICFP